MQGDEGRTGLVPNKGGRWEMILKQKLSRLHWCIQELGDTGRSCRKRLLSHPGWQHFPGALRASASSAHRAADGPHLSADEILIYLSLTDGARPWSLAGVQGAGQLSGDVRFYKWIRYCRLRPWLVW